MNQTIASGPDSAIGFAINDLAGRIAAYTRGETRRFTRPEMSHPAASMSVAVEPVEGTFREYQHPISAAARVVPLFGSLDDATLRLLEHVVARRDDEARRVAVLQIAPGAVATRPALLALRQAHQIAFDAGNWIVMVSPDPALREVISDLKVPEGRPVIADTNARAMEYALSVVSDDHTAEHARVA
jgi:hypothetical protein